MRISSQQLAGVALAALGLIVAATQAEVGPGGVEWRLTPIPEVVDAVPPLPPPSTFPVQLVLDDDNAEGSFGVAGQFSRQFLWFNRFTAGPGFHLEEVWVLFPSGANMSVGGAVEIAIYEDPDGDPTNGAALLASFNTTIQAVDGNTFSIYPLATALTIPAGSDVLIGVVPRFIVSGVTPPTTPAALDTSGSQSRSWLAVWSTDPPDPPTLVPLPDQTLSLVDAFVPGGGNWMIRGFGTPQGTVEIPTLGGLGLAVLALVLAAAALLALRRRRSVSAFALLLLTFAVPAGAQTTIDSFTTTQPTLSAPPDASSTATGGADILGTRRGIVQHELAGAGPSTVGVAAGLLTLTVPGTTPDSRAEARLSWDGDLLPAVLDPTGLGGVDLTTSSSTGLRIRVASAGANAELELTVYSSAVNFSRAARLLPAIASSTDVFLPFNELRVAGGTGADFASVGAIELTVRGKEITVVLDEIVTSGPTPAATKTATQVPVDVDGDGRVDPGDRVRYTVTFTNSGNNAVNVDLSDTVDPNTTLVAASVSTTPLARNDQYGWFGNVTLTADGSPFPTLLANDSDPDGDTVVVQSVVSPSVQGGTVTLVSAATGEFTYVPPAGFKGVDSFTYTINDGETHTSTATATIDLEGVVWFVDNGCTVGCGAGTQASPFQTLPAAETPSGANDIIYVRTGIASYDTGPATGFTLDVDEQLLGEGVALVLGGTTIVPAGAPPTLTNIDGTPGRGLTLAGTGAGTDTVRGLTIGATGAAKVFGSAFGTFASDTVTLNGNGQALDLTNGVLAATFASISSGASAATGISLNQVSGTLTSTGGTTISASTAQGISVTQSTASENFGNTSVTGGTDGVSLQNNSTATHTFGTLAIATGSGIGFLHSLNGGTVSVTGATTITNPTGTGISISLSTSPVTFASTTINKGASSGIGLSLSGNTNTTSFSNLVVTTSAGPGIVATSSTLSLGGTASTVAATGGAALDLTTVTLAGGATFASASSTGSTGKGMNLDTITNALTINGGSISTPAGIAFDLNAGSANVTYAGSISNVANAFLVEITGRTGGTVALSGVLSGTGSSNGINVANNNVSGSPIINFSNASKVLNTAADPAVTLDNNDVATINFTGGGLAITTTSGIGFNAINGATAITVQGTANTLSSTTGTALNVASTTIGASGLTFQSISANGAARGIVLNGTGASGGLTVTGNGGTCTAADTSGCSGGTIQASTGADDSTTTPVGTGIVLNSTANVSLTRMFIHDHSNYGIRGTSVAGFILDQSVFNGTNGGPLPASAGSPFHDGTIKFDNLTGSATISNSAISGGFSNNVRVDNTTGTLNRITFTADTIGANSTSDGEDGILLETESSGGVILATVQNCIFTSARGDLFNFVSNGTNATADDLVFTNNTLTNNHPAIATGGGGTTISSNGAKNFTFSMSGNSFRDAVGIGVLLVKSTGASTFAGTFDNNSIGVVATANSGSLEGSAIKVQNAGLGAVTVAITNNQIRQYNNNGIELLTGGGASPLSGSLNATVTNNTITNPGNNPATAGIAKNGLHLNAGTVPGDTYQICLDAGGAGALQNSLSTSGAPSDIPAGGEDIRLRQRQSTTVQLRGYTGANNDNTAVQNYLIPRNSGDGAPSAIASNNVPPPGQGYVNTPGPGNACPLP